MSGQVQVWRGSQGYPNLLAKLQRSYNICAPGTDISMKCHFWGSVVFFIWCAMCATHEQGFETVDSSTFSSFHCHGIWVSFRLNTLSPYIYYHGQTSVPSIFRVALKAGDAWKFWRQQYLFVPLESSELVLQNWLRFIYIQKCMNCQELWGKHTKMIGGRIEIPYIHMYNK